MGGHGGLNILPQKKWNVYGRENRLKVARDEAEHEKKTEENEKKKRKADAESKRALLLKKARQRHGGRANYSLNDDLNDEVEDKPAPVAAAAPTTTTTATTTAAKEARECRTRGNPKTQTSDARFDQSFRFAHGLHESVPWYAQNKVAHPQDDKTSLLSGVSLKQQADLDWNRLREERLRREAEERKRARLL